MEASGHRGVGALQRRIPPIILAAVLLLMPVRASAAEFLVQPERSELVVKVYKAGLASALAHDHVVRATRLRGLITGDPTNPESGFVELIVQAGSLVADEPEMRRKHGLPKGPGDSDRRQIQSSMLGEGQLDAAKYPEIAFRSTSVQPQGSNRVIVSGDFTLHGTTRRISLPVVVRVTTDSVEASGTFDFNQSDFGITPYSAFLGAVRNRDRLTLLFDVTAIRR